MGVSRQMKWKMDKDMEARCDSNAGLGLQGLRFRFFSLTNSGLARASQRPPKCQVLRL